MEEQISANKRDFDLKRKRIFFILLLIYSILPGVYKILDNQLIMLGSIPILLYVAIDIRHEVKLYRYDSFFLFFLLYILFQTFFLFFSPLTNKIGMAMGIYMNFFPMVGYFVGKSIKFENLSNILLKIILFHCILGIILYPPFRITNVYTPIVSVLKEGVAISRMSSVSGSLGFGNLLMIGFIISIFLNKKYLPFMIIGLFFSSQRSAWLGGIFGLLLYFIYLFRNKKITSLLLTFCILAIFFVSTVIIVEQYSQFDLSYSISRIESIKDASYERINQWENGISNFINYPIGVGVGQAGQFAARYESAVSNFKAIPDSDYLRSLSEYGFAGGLFFIYVITIYIFSFFFLQFKNKEFIALFALMGGQLIQMIGSNISEFYFTNFIFWIIIGYFCTLIGKRYTFIIK